MSHSGQLDPERIRTRVLDALRDLAPSDRQLEALAAISRGEVDIEDDPVVGEILVQIGDLTVVVARDQCVDNGSGVRSE